jgi:hypothetical protein
MPRESPSKKYVAATDYGTRKSTLNQQHVRFGTYKGTIVSTPASPLLEANARIATVAG